MDRTFWNRVLLGAAAGLLVSLLMPVAVKTGVIQP